MQYILREGERDSMITLGHEEKSAGKAFCAPVVSFYTLPCQNISDMTGDGQIFPQIFYLHILNPLTLQKTENCLFHTFTTDERSILI